MKCPYREFKECIVEQCPSCNYEVVKTEVIAGRYPHYMDIETAIKNGNAWKETQINYKFISCSLVNNNVPLPSVNKQVVNNSTETNVAVIKRSIF